MPAPKKPQSKPKSGLSGTPTLGQSKPKAKPVREKNKTAETFRVLGGAKAGGGLGYSIAARDVIRKEVKAKGLKPREAADYFNKRINPLEKQMAAERGRTATRAKAQLKKKNKGSYIRETSTKQIDYTGGRKPTYKVTKKK